MGLGLLTLSARYLVVNILNMLCFCPFIHLRKRIKHIINVGNALAAQQISGSLAVYVGYSRRNIIAFDHTDVPALDFHNF